MNVKQIEDLEGILKILECLKFKDNTSVNEGFGYFEKFNKFARALGELRAELNAPAIKPIEPVAQLIPAPGVRGRPRGDK